MFNLVVSNYNPFTGNVKDQIAKARSLGVKCVSVVDINFDSFSSASGRRGGLMVSALVSGSSGPGSSPGRIHCVVFLGKTLCSHSASLHPGA